MSETCLLCLGTSKGAEPHPACVERLFGIDRCPQVDLGSKTLDGALAEQTGRISISGVQQKLLVDLSRDGSRLEPADRGRYILKPRVAGYRDLPENEHVSMQLARLIGLPTPPNGLVWVAHNHLAYVVKRFDRTDDKPPRKLRQEDFCSLSLRDPVDKYEASAEECADLCLRHTKPPGESLRQLFLLFAFSYWISNEDLHLKNLSLLEGRDGSMRLSPCYDLLSTRLYPQLNHKEALTLNDKKEQLVRGDFIALGARCSLLERDAVEMIDQMLATRVKVESVVRSSALSADSQREYIKWMKYKAKLLAPRKAVRG